MTAKTRVPAVEGWFTFDTDEPALLGTKCTSCGTFSFPRETFSCKNPDCLGRTFDEVELSRTGTIWSYTNNCFQPPPPYVATTDPYEPVAIAAVELAGERIVVLGQVAHGVPFESLAVGQSVELVVETLFEDDDAEHLVWRWKPTDPANATGAPA